MGQLAGFPSSPGERPYLLELPMAANCTQLTLPDAECISKDALLGLLLCGALVKQGYSGERAAEMVAQAQVRRQAECGFTWDCGGESGDANGGH